nr:MAK10-like protein [Tanacetum cinerariifolium]
MFVEFVIQNQFFSYSLEDFAQILNIPCEDACAFTDRWSLDELAYGVPSDGQYQTNPPSLDDIISSSRRVYVLYDRVMTPLAAQLKRKPRKDRGTRRVCHSTSSSTFNEPSSSNLNDDDDGNNEGTSCASTPSPIHVPPRPLNPQPLQSHPSLDITLSLSPITPLDHTHDTLSPPSPPQPQPAIMGHSHYYNYNDYHGSNCICCFYNRTLFVYLLKILMDLRLTKNIRMIGYMSGIKMCHSCKDDGYCNGWNLLGAYIVGNILRYQDLEWYEALKDSKLKEEALKNQVIMEGMIDEDKESSNKGWRRWDDFENTDRDNEETENEMEHEDEERCEVFGDHERPLCYIRRFEMVKYSFRNDEEYIHFKKTPIIGKNPILKNLWLNKSRPHQRRTRRRQPVTAKRGRVKASMHPDRLRGQQRKKLCCVKVGFLVLKTARMVMRRNNMAFGSEGSKRHKSSGSSLFNTESGKANINLNTIIGDTDEDESFNILGWWTIPLDKSLFKEVPSVDSSWSKSIHPPFSGLRNENHIRTLGDYSKPSHKGYMNTIELSVGNNMAWTRFKDLLQKVPHHGIDLLAPSPNFYDHFNPVTRRTIDQSAGGKLRDRNAKESWALLVDLALYDNESWNNPRDFSKMVKTITLPQDVPSTSNHRLIELENQVQRLMEAHLDPTQPTKVNKVTTSCEICSGPHDTQYCMEDPEQAFVEYTSLRTDEARGAIPSDTVKNPKLSTSPVLSARSYPTMNPQCLTHVYVSINPVTIHSKKQGDPYDEKAKENEEKEMTAQKIFMSTFPLRLIHRLQLSPKKSSNATHSSNHSGWFLNHPTLSEGEPEEEGSKTIKGVGAEYFDTFLTRSELAYHKIDEVAYKMPHMIEQYNSLPDLEKEHTKSVYLRNKEDKRRGVEYVMSKILGFYKECLELGPEYVTGTDDEGEFMHLEEIHVTWAHLEKKRTRLRTNTKTLQDLKSQSLETASPFIHDVVALHLVTTSQFFLDGVSPHRLNSDLEDSTL